MTIEIQEIGLKIGEDVGTYHNTEYVDGSVQLKAVGENEFGDIIYENEGYWESEVIELKGKFKDYDKVVLSKEQMSSDAYAILTRVSDDGEEFSQYVATTPEGKIQSEMKQFIQVRINLFAGLKELETTISNFNSEEDIDKWVNSEFVEIKDGSLRLKREHSFEMNQEKGWQEDGSLHRKAINGNEWKRIDKLGVE